MGKKGFIILGIIFLLILALIITAIIWYQLGIKAPIEEETSGSEIIVDITSGTSTTQILNLLEENNVIKDELAAKIYISLHEVKSLQAGKYLFSGKETLVEVLNALATGNVMDETITITFKEGKNMRNIASTIAENTNNTTNAVYQLLGDNDYIESLIQKYWFLSEDIQNTNIYYPLEGYLYPDTYTFENKDVDIKTIFEKMLNKMDTILAQNKTIIDNSNYSVHQILTMASIVELEGNNAENRKKIASVIYNRLASNMSLGSDVTTYYAIRVDMGERDLYAREINTYNEYNTRGPNMEGKLPIGPIANSSAESIEAVLNPVEETYLYFVADKNGEIYFSETYEEHQTTIADLRKKGLWYEYEE